MNTYFKTKNFLLYCIFHFDFRFVTPFSLFPDSSFLSLFLSLTSSPYVYLVHKYTLTVSGGILSVRLVFQHVV